MYCDCGDRAEDAGWSCWTCSTCERYRAARARGEQRLHGGHYLEPPPDVAPPRPLIGGQPMVASVLAVLSPSCPRGVEELAARAGLPMRETRAALDQARRQGRAHSTGHCEWRRTPDVRRHEPTLRQASGGAE